VMPIAAFGTRLYDRFPRAAICIVAGLVFGCGPSIVLASLVKGVNIKE